MAHSQIPTILAAGCRVMRCVEAVLGCEGIMRRVGGIRRHVSRWVGEDRQAIRPGCCAGIAPPRPEQETYAYVGARPDRGEGYDHEREGKARFGTGPLIVRRPSRVKEMRLIRRVVGCELR